MQGKAALHDLVLTQDVNEIIAADVDSKMLSNYVAQAGWSNRVRIESFNADEPETIKKLLAKKPHVVIDLLPVDYISIVAKLAVEHGVHLVNTLYVRDEIAMLHDEAIRKGISILPEFGLDPGIDLVMLGDGVRSLDSVEEIHSYGAGIPEFEAADNPLHYKVSWTLDGVLKAYRRPAEGIRDGSKIKFTASQIFSPENIHEVEIGGLGKLEAYANGSSLSLLQPLGLNPEKIKQAWRYTLRWPGHCAFWKNLIDLHLLDEDPVLIDNNPVDRIKYLAGAIEPHIQYKSGERDIALVRVELIGQKSGKCKRLIYQLIDYRDLHTGLSAMSRTVGFTASIGAGFLAGGGITKRGLLSPLTDIPYPLLELELRKRGIKLTRTEIDLEV